MFHNLKSQRTLDNSTLNLRILNQNILYVTREVDKILKVVESLRIAQSNQQQVDEYFEKDETSPQTDSDEQ